MKTLNKKSTRQFVIIEKVDGDLFTAVYDFANLANYSDVNEIVVSRERSTGNIFVGDAEVTGELKARLNSAFNDAYPNEEWGAEADKEDDGSYIINLIDDYRKAEAERTNDLNFGATTSNVRVVGIESRTSINLSHALIETPSYANALVPLSALEVDGVTVLTRDRAVALLVRFYANWYGAKVLSHFSKLNNVVDSVEHIYDNGCFIVVEPIKR